MSNNERLMIDEKKIAQYNAEMAEHANGAALI